MLPEQEDIGILHLDKVVDTDYLKSHGLEMQQMDHYSQAGDKDFEGLARQDMRALDL